LGTQAFLYNAIFFTYALVLTNFYGVSDARVGLFILPFAVGNFLGPLLLGPLFDTLGRRVMISGTYILSGILLAITAWMFNEGMLTATTQTLCWSVIFFFASAGASSGYLTVSELFPLEVRALAIALFYAIGTGIGGALAPSIFGALIGSGDASNVVIGYLVGAGLMILAPARIGPAAGARRRRNRWRGPVHAHPTARRRRRPDRYVTDATWCANARTPVAESPQQLPVGYGLAAERSDR
jgi:MFS family permease